MIQILIRILLTPIALIADLLHFIVVLLMLVLLAEEIGMLIQVPEGFIHNHFPCLYCLWKRPWFKNKE